MGNVRVTFYDNNCNGLLVSDEIRSRNDYYPFGLEWNNRWELSDTISPLNLKRYNGKELWTKMDLNLLHFENRLLDRELNRFNTVDKLSWHPNQVDKSAYSAMWNNPFRYNDPDGNCPQCSVGFAIGFIADIAG
jgi:RHS repeat-associated protein